MQNVARFDIDQRIVCPVGFRSDANEMPTPPATGLTPMSITTSLRGKWLEEEEEEEEEGAEM